VTIWTTDHAGDEWESARESFIHIRGIAQGTVGHSFAGSRVLGFGWISGHDNGGDLLFRLEFDRKIDIPGAHFHGFDSFKTRRRNFRGVHSVRYRGYEEVTVLISFGFERNLPS